MSRRKRETTGLNIVTIHDEAKGDKPTSIRITPRREKEVFES